MLNNKMEATHVLLLLFWFSKKNKNNLCGFVEIFFNNFLLPLCVYLVANKFFLIWKVL